MKIEKISKKQKEILKFAYSDEETLICDGAVRSGKTIMMITAFVIWAMENFDRTNFAICGKTVSNAERNIVRPFQQIEDLPFTLNYKISTRMLTVKCGKKENYFYLFGGKDESSYALIQGLTLAGVLFDEVALMPQSFVDQAIARTLSFKNAKIWFNCNPESPNHWFYTEWITNEEREYKHLHFLMNDNPTLGEEEIKRAESLFTGVFYERYILGRWVRAEGIIFQDLAEHTDNYLVDNIETGFRWCGVGYDLGGNKSNYALVASALGYDGILYVLKAVEIEPQDLRIEDVEKAAQEFIESVESEYNTRVSICYVDDNYYTTINGLNDWRYIFDTAASIKGNMPLEDRPLMLSKLMAQGRFKLAKGECEPLIFQLQNAVFDDRSEKAVILDDGSLNIDCIDALFYSFADNYVYISR